MMVTAHPVVLARELDRSLGRLRARTGQVAAVQVAGAGGGEALRELDCALRREEDRAGARDPARLRRVRLDDVLAAMSERGLPHRRAEIEVPVASIIGQPGALALGEHAKHVAVDEIDAWTLVDPQVVDRGVLGRDGQSGLPGRCDYKSHV